MGGIDGASGNTAAPEEQVVIGYIFILIFCSHSNPSQLKSSVDINNNDSDEDSSDEEEEFEEV